MIDLRRCAATAVLTAILACSGVAADRVQPSAQFAQQVAALSEREGYFDTDNLISNESSYQQVLPELRRRNVRGGAYIGVGPDQNFTYIATTRPSMAFIVDVRRDNLLLQLLFKALFTLSRTRVDYLAQLLGRPVPAEVESWRAAPIDRLVSYVDAPVASPQAIDALRARVDAAVTRSGVTLSAEDLRTIDRFHRRFIEEGVSLRFQSTGRPPRSYYPTYRQLLTDTDGSGRQANYLASEDAFQFLKGLQARDQSHPGRRRSQRPLRDCGDRQAPRRAALRGLGVLRLERGVLSVRRGSICSLRHDLGRLHTRRQQRDHPLRVRRIRRRLSAGRRQCLAAAADRRAADRCGCRKSVFGDLVGR